MLGFVVWCNQSLYILMHTPLLDLIFRLQRIFRASVYEAFPSCVELYNSEYRLSSSCARVATDPHQHSSPDSIAITHNTHETPCDVTRTTTSELQQKCRVEHSSLRSNSTSACVTIARVCNTVRWANELLLKTWNMQSSSSCLTIASKQEIYMQQYVKCQEVPGAFLSSEEWTESQRLGWLV